MKHNHPNYISIKKIVPAFALLLLTMLQPACKHDRVTLFEPNLKFRPAGEFINNNYEFSLFNAALKITGLSETLNGPGPFTVFAPTDQAFNNIGIRKPVDFQKMNVDSLRIAMKYHIVSQRVSSIDVTYKTIDNPFNTLLNVPALLGMGDNADYHFFINGSNITRRDIDLSNGILHSINKVIKYHPVTIKSYLESQERYSIFTAALRKFGLLDQLGGEEHWTLMAVPNSAFKKLNITKADIEQLNPQAYKKRLFGSYLFKLEFFKSDLLILPKSGGSGSYALSGAAVRRPIPGDEEYSHGISGYSYSLFLIQTDHENYPIPNESELADYDHLDLYYKNGVIHEVQDLLMRPEEALIRP